MTIFLSTIVFNRINPTGVHEPLEVFRVTDLGFCHTPLLPVLTPPSTRKKIFFLKYLQKDFIYMRFCTLITSFVSIFRLS